jgi:hypothetical protein
MSLNTVHEAQTLRMQGARAAKRQISVSDRLEHRFFADPFEYDRGDDFDDDGRLYVPQRGGLAALAGIAVGLGVAGLLWVGTGRHRSAPVLGSRAPACDGKPCVDPALADPAMLAAAPAMPAAAPAMPAAAPAMPAAAPAMPAAPATNIAIPSVPIEARTPAAAQPDPQAALTPPAVVSDRRAPPAPPVAAEEVAAEEVAAEEAPARADHRRAAAPIRDMVWSDRLQRLVASDFVPPAESPPVPPVAAQPAASPPAVAPAVPARTLAPPAQP